MAKKLLEVKGLKQYFGKAHAPIRAVDDLSFDVYEGEVLGLVGESGCGKSTTGRSIIGLYDITDGEIYFDGQLVSKQQTAAAKKAFAKQVQMIFQDPYASLNPRMTAGEIIGEAYDIHDLYKNKSERQAKIGELLEAVGLNREHANRYAHEFSGGQRQRIGIARALALEPKFIIADEPISALDVSIQAQVVNLLKKLQKERQLTYLFIAHDLSMVKYISDRIAVMYGGKLLEIGLAADIYRNPVHPYTKSLLSAVPQPDPISESKRVRISYSHESEEGEVVRREVSPGHYVFGTPGQVERWVTAD
ncbi:ATP-binding cassette domain-containing protein [Aerococcaceae bacterium NML191292]|nr:ATP-binding cassette domain-containing protein [Aerococcaceae bacterium NML191292]MCW6674980.1 ATP-binding cassette domain-containing protein [Aerococcaceae bacterium NML171108]MCW6676302.1 ATP-binding cassette domain-containing protein [Aerococcaceae bacterium NML180378]MCW6679869.1 ATP-binding cassette domain-containing protein [Aerococcaceae bacterium NML130460]